MAADSQAIAIEQWWRGWGPTFPRALAQRRLARVSSQTAVRYREPLCLPAGVGKPRLVYPGMRLASEEASTPVAMSW
jgi:hypothetical protein